MERDVQPEEVGEQAAAQLKHHLLADPPGHRDEHPGSDGLHRDRDRERGRDAEQRQRVALARAILSRPEVLILDDPLSALDVHTEERVTRALHRILAGSTALVVAHRPSTVALADTVALLSGGVIAASGSHRQLLASNPEYAALMDVEDLEASA